MKYLLIIVLFAVMAGSAMAAPFSAMPKQNNITKAGSCTTQCFGSGDNRICYTNCY